MSDEPGEALRVLRSIWAAHGQGSADLEECGTGRHCKRMSGVGFGDLDASGEELRVAWRERLEREGKLRDAGASVRDLVLGPPPAR